MKKEFSLLLAAAGIAAGCTLTAGDDFSGRRNIAESVYGSFAEITHADGSKNPAPSVNSGRRDDSAAVVLKGVPATLTVEFPAPTQINAVRIYPGNLTNAGYASGESGIRDYVIERFNNGYWHKIAEGKNQPGFNESGAHGTEEYFFTHTFKPVNANAVRITVTRSGDTGKRMNSNELIPEEKRTSYIRAFEVYEAKKSGERLAQLNQVLTGDFRLPVHRDQPTAKLMLTLDPFFNGFNAKMVISEEKTGRVISSETVKINRGETLLPIELEKFPDGRYFVVITSDDDKLKGEFRRLLRIDRGGRAELPAEPVDVAGIRIFPIDDFHFAERTGVVTEVVPAEAIETTRSLSPDRPVQDARSGNWFDLDEAGNFVMMFRDYDLKRQNPQTHYAVSRDLKQWSVVDQTPTGKPNRRVPSPWDPLPETAQPKWQQKTPFADAKIRFYEESDGKPPLNEIRVVWLPPTLGDIAAKGLVPWGNYPVWEKNPGEWIVLTRDPLIVCKFGFEPDELETEIDSNDNFAPQFLADDGKTLFYNQAAKVRRFPPFTVEYDNIRQGARLMRTHYTHDGFNWETRFVALPTEEDNWSFQHYGIAINRISRDFYLGLLYAYPATHQQIYQEVIYSRDGLNWNRLPGSKPFVANTPVGTWLFGLVFTEYLPPPFEHDGKYILALGSNRRNQHFYLTNLRNQPERLTTAYLRRSFGDRDLEKHWPYFKEIGGWEGLARDMREYATTSGIAVFRKDGWIAVRAPESGSLTSRIFTAPGTELYLNARGDITIELLGSDGEALPEYAGANAARFTGDSTAAKLSWGEGKLTRMPDTPFRLRIRMAAGAELYTLNFR